MPRKSYREYHADVFPDTAGTRPGLGVDDWLGGATVPTPKVSLNPANRGNSLADFGQSLADIPRKVKLNEVQMLTPANNVEVSENKKISTSNNTVSTNNSLKADNTQQQGCIEFHQI